MTSSGNVLKRFVQSKMSTFDTKELLNVYCVSQNHAKLRKYNTKDRKLSFPLHEDSLANVKHMLIAHWRRYITISITCIHFSGEYGSVSSIATDYLG